MENKIRVKPLHMQFTAVQVNHDFWLDSPLGKSRGFAGDYIVMSDSGFMVVVPEYKFENDYQIVK